MMIFNQQTDDYVRWDKHPEAKDWLQLAMKSRDAEKAVKKISEGRKNVRDLARSVEPMRVAS